MACMPTSGITCALHYYDEEPPEKIPELADDLHQVITQWYPDLGTKVYCPSHFRAVYYAEHPEELKNFKNIFCLKRDEVKHSDVKNDEAQQRMLWTFATFCLRKNSKKDQPAFLLSNMNFHQYLCKYKPSGVAAVEKPKVRVEGETDIIVIDQKFGIVILEIKSTGDDVGARSTSDHFKKDLTATIKRTKKPLVEQVKRQVEKMSSIIGCLKLDHPISIRAAVLLPNIERKILDDVLKDLTDVPGLQDLVFLCKEDLPSKEESWRGELTEQKYDAIQKMWTDAKHSAQPMLLKSYQYMVSLFAGPWTSVRVYYNNTMPRLGKECIQQGGAAHMMAARFSVLVLHSNQIEILVKDKDEMDNKAAQFVHLEGPPGTGKTLTLLIRVLTWLDEGHVVWLLSLSPQSRSITHALHEQVKQMLYDYKFSQECMPEGKKEEYIKRLRRFMMIKPAETCSPEYFEKRLRMCEDRARILRDEFQLADEQGKVCIVLDETLIDSSSEDCAVNKMFFDAVSKLYREDAEKQRQQESGTTPLFKRGLSVWSAALHKGGRPCYVTEYGKQTEERFGLLWELKFPMRCPPSVQRALMCVQDSLEADKVCCFSKATAVAHPVKEDEPEGLHNQYVAHGMPVKMIAHGSHGSHSNRVDSVWECSECGTELADYLRHTLHIGETEKAERLKLKFATQDKFLPFASVIIVSTRRAYKSQTLNSGFQKAMANMRLEIALSASREEGDAPMPDSVNRDVIMVSDITSIHGLERAVVIIIPEVKTDYSRSQGSEGEEISGGETPMEEEGSGGDPRGANDPGGPDRTTPSCEEDRFKAAFASLHEQCRRDIFFIGSRAVSQLIVFHSGKELAVKVGPPAHGESHVTQATGGESRSLSDSLQVAKGTGDISMETR